MRNSDAPETQSPALSLNPQKPKGLQSRHEESRPGRRDAGARAWLTALNRPLLTFRVKSATLDLPLGPGLPMSPEIRQITRSMRWDENPRAVLSPPDRHCKIFPLLLPQSGKFPTRNPHPRAGKETRVKAQST